MTILYLLSFWKSSIFGLPLKYYNHFVPFAENLHQISMFLVPLPFIGFNILTKEKLLLKKIFIIMIVVADILMTFSTGSTKASVAIFVGIFILVCAKLYLIIQRKYKYLIFAIVPLSIAFLLTYINKLEQYFRLFFVENDGGNARAFLYKDALEIGSQSFVFGLGTGPHLYAIGQYFDAHQTFATAFLQAGIIGVLLLITLYYKLIRRIIKYPAIVAACSTIFFYSLGGDILRRLPIWIILVLLYYYREEDVSKSITPSNI
jgi:hypothetical protein